MRAVIDGAIRIPHRAISAGERSRIMAKLSYPNPSYGGAIARARMYDYEAKLDDIPRRLEYFTEEEDVLVVPRGALSLVRAIAPGLCFEDRTMRLARFPFRLRGKLRDYQGEALQDLATEFQAIGCMPCGAGKTWVGAATIAHRRQVTMVLVNSHDLADQWRETVEAALGISCGTIKDDAAVCVDTVHAAMKADGLERFGLVIYDEVHHLPAQMFFGTLPKFPARYRLGLTATPERDDGLSKPIFMGIGPIAARVGYQRLIRDGWLMAPEVRWVMTEWECRTRSFTAALNQLAADVGREEIIRRIVLRMLSENRQTLTVSSRKPHLRSIARNLADAGAPAALLLGDQARGIRRQVLARARAGEARNVLATSNIAAEGLDIPGLEAAIIGSFARAKNRAIQTMGRLTRIREGKRTPILWDLVDRGEMPREHALARRDAYRDALGRHYRESRQEVSEI